MRILEKLPLELFRKSAPYEYHKHCCDENLRKKGHKIVLNNLNKKPNESNSNQK